MFGQTFHNLPRLFARTVRKGALTFTEGCANCGITRASAQGMEPSTSVCTNLPGRMRKPSAPCCTNLQPLVSQTLASCRTSTHFQNHTRASKLSCQQHICAGAGDSQIHEERARSLRVASFAWSSIFDPAFLD
jgi:hypothetical protein